jgi:hypothetical protein
MAKHHQQQHHETEVGHAGEEDANKLNLGDRLMGLEKFLVVPLIKLM